MTDYTKEMTLDDMEALEEEFTATAPKGSNSDTEQRAEEAKERAEEYFEYIIAKGLPLAVKTGGEATRADALVYHLAKLDLSNPVEWLKLAAEIGPGAVFPLLDGGRAGIHALHDVKRAVELRAEAARDNRRWLNAEGRGIPSNKARRALLVCDDDETGQDASYLPGGVVGLVVAAGGTGKTTWLAELAMRVAWNAAPTTWPPYKIESDAHGPVMVLLAEEDEEGLDKALYRGLQRVLGNKAADLKVEEWKNQVFALAGADRDTSLGLMVTTKDPVRGQLTEVVPSPLLEALVQQARTIGPLLVILDPINQLLPTGSSENDAVAAASMLSLAGLIRKAAEEGVRNRWSKEMGRPGEEYAGPRPTVLLAHHERKNADNNAGAEAARGSSAFVDNARWVMRMTRERRGDEERAFFSVVKSNYTRWWEHRGVVGYEKHGLEWRKESADDAARWRDLGEKSKSAGAEKWDAEELAEQVKIAGASGIARSKAENKALAGAVEEAIDQGLVVAVERGNGFTLFAPERKPGKGIEDLL